MGYYNCTRCSKYTKYPFTRAVQQLYQQAWQCMTSLYINLTLGVQEGGPGAWWPLDAEVVMEGGRILRTKNPTGHAVLVDCRFEIPCGKLTGRLAASVYCTAPHPTQEHKCRRALMCVCV